MGHIESGKTVAIIGGGFSGALVSAHLARHPAFANGRIVVFEPRDHLGRGLAYDTDNEAHRVNVPASRMSLVPEDEDHFVTWLEKNGELARDEDIEADDAKLYPRRGAFGRYVSDFVRPSVLSGIVRHEKSAVVQVIRQGRHWQVTSASGQTLSADILVIATSHPSPQAPGVLDRALKGDPRYIPDPTLPGAVSFIGGQDRVLVVGAGLTSADILATLDRQGHRGPITVFSRRGLRSRGHPLTVQEPFGDFTTEPALSALALLRRIRRSVRAASLEGLSWHAVFDALRGQGGEIWRGLPVAERRKLVRHLRAFWDVHRFRIAPQLEQVIERGLSSGRLRFLAASVSRIDPAPGAITVDLRLRGRGTIDRRDYDAVIVTTGPAHGGILSSQPWLADLARAGHVKADDVGLGIACDSDSHALGREGQVTLSLFISGPLARGTFGELMGLPQVTDHAVFVADRVAHLVGQAVVEDGRNGNGGA